MQTSRHCGRRERETIGGKLPTVLYVRVSSSYHGKVVLKITAVLLKNSTALLIKQACLYEKQSKFSIPIRTLCGLCVSAIVVVCCRCVLHRLCSTTCMRPCIEPLGVLSRHPCQNPNPFPSVKGSVCLVGSASCRAFGHTRPASVPGLSVGLPPSPRFGLRPKPHFKKLYSFLTD